MKVMYTLRRIRRNDSMHGPYHGSHDVQQSLCGRQIDENWYIINNTGSGEITCSKCLKALGPEVPDVKEQ